MGFDAERLTRIFDKTEGCCFHCGKQLAWNNYGKRGFRGAWEVDHGHPVSRGGTDHLNNLWPACVDCNHTKSDMTVRQFRSVVTPRESNKPDSSAVWILGGLALLGLAAAATRRRGPPPPPGFQPPFKPPWEF